MLHRRSVRHFVLALSTLGWGVKIRFLLLSGIYGYVDVGQLI
jgi:hypothetical protein